MLNNQELQFPVDWEYRIMVDADSGDGCLAELTRILRENGETAPLECGRESSGGKFRSYRVKVRFECREKMEKLSSELGRVNGVKYLL